MTYDLVADVGLDCHASLGILPCNQKSAEAKAEEFGCSSILYESKNLHLLILGMLLALCHIVSVRRNAIATPPRWPHLNADKNRMCLLFKK